MGQKDPIPEAELQALLRSAQEGAAASFERVYDHFFSQIYRYCVFRLEKEEAEDATTDIFVKAWEKLHTYRPQSGIPFAAWLFRIARTTVIDAYRARTPFQEMPDDLADTDALNASDHALQQKELVQMVRSHLDRLPARYREVLVLSYIAGLPGSEVARVLKMREGAVRVLKLRALRKLEDLLPPESSFSS